MKAQTYSEININNIHHIKCVLLIGLGRIGLPQALDFAHCGIKVYAYDQDATAVELLKSGKTPFYEPLMDNYLKNTINEKFLPFSLWSELKAYISEIDAIVFTIGTSAPKEQDVVDGKKLDFTAYFTLLDMLFMCDGKMKVGIKIIIRTTLPLGGTDMLKNYIEDKFALHEGTDFFLAFVPERITEGVAIKELRTLPKIIGAYRDEAFYSIKELFESTDSETIKVRNPIIAEFCKLTDNAFRSTLFSFANDIAMYSSHLDVDVGEVIKTVNFQYDRNNIPLPGFVSGYCLSKDPYIFELAFTKNIEQRDFHSVWHYGRKTNDYLIEFVVNKVLQHINLTTSSCVAILGLAFKENVDDFRFSHSLDIIDLLIKRNVKRLRLYDPYLAHNKYTKLSDNILSYTEVKSNILDSDFFSNVEAIIICDKHAAIINVNKYDILNKLLQQTAKPCYIFDGWDIWKDSTRISHVEYEGIGFKEHNKS